jgi:hypothetical protein
MTSNPKAATIQLQRLNAQNDDLLKKIAAERQRQQDVERTTAELATHIDKMKRAKKEFGGAFASRDSSRRAQKDVRECGRCEGT